MTFTNIVTEITGRLNYNSSDATTRIGKAVNRVYRRVTTAIGMVTSRRVQVSQAKSLGSAELTFSGIEKIERVFDDTSGSIVMLRQVTYDELRSVDAGTGTPTAFAVKSIGPDSVTIRLDVLAQDTDVLKADGHSSVADLSGSDEPAFPESFHDVLIEGVLAEELRKQEKPALAKMAQEAHDRTLSDLKFFIAKSGYLQNKQNKLQQGASQGSAPGGGSAPSGGTSYTQTGLITFDRPGTGVAPFVVAADNNGVVANLNADLLDGEDSADFHDAAQLVGEVPVASIPAHPHVVADVTPVAASTLIGRGSAGGSGAAEEITIGSNLSMSGTTLSAVAAPTGAITMFGSATPPTGWLECDGSAVSRATYVDLFAVIGETWGVGDGSTTFNLPDMRGRAPIGRGTGSGLTARTLANAVGAETHQLTSSEMPSHTHTQNAHNHGVTDPGHTHQTGYKDIGALGAGANRYLWTINTGDGNQTSTNSATTGLTVNNATATNQNTGGNGSHNNMQPSRVVTFIIKT